MWQLFLGEIARQLELQAVRSAGWKIFRKLIDSELNKTEAYADRIKRPGSAASSRPVYERQSVAPRDETSPDAANKRRPVR